MKQQIVCGHGDCSGHNTPAVGNVFVQMPIDGGVFRISPDGKVTTIRKPDGKVGYYELPMCAEHIQNFFRQT